MCLLVCVCACYLPYCCCWVTAEIYPFGKVFGRKWGISQVFPPCVCVCVCILCVHVCVYIVLVKSFSKKDIDSDSCVSHWEGLAQSVVLYICV